MEKFDYQALQDLKNSIWWKILSDTLEERIRNIETVLLEPEDSDMFQGLDEVKKLNLISYKKMERKYLISLRDLPQELLLTKIKIENKKE